MKVEIAALAQSLECLQIELRRHELTMGNFVQRMQAALNDLLEASVQTTNLQAVAPERIAEPGMPRPLRTRQTRLYASGELTRKVLAILSTVDELSLKDLLIALQADKPGTQMASLRPCMTNLVQGGQVVWVRKSVYRLPERKPHLSVISR